MFRVVMLFLAFVGTVLAANVAVDLWQFTPAGFGLMVPAGTWFAGMAFILRDELQRVASRRFTLRQGMVVVVAAVLAGAALSWFLARPELAVASAVAFGASEIVDMIVFMVSGRKLAGRLLSNLIAAPIDTALFLWLSGLGALALEQGGREALLSAAGGQVLVKAVYLAPLAVVIWWADKARDREGRLADVPA